MASEKQKKRGRAFLGKTIRIRIDRPLGTRCPQRPEEVFPVNCGIFVDGPEGEGTPWDVYLLGVSEPVQEYTARVIGAVRREDGTGDRLVAAPEGMCFHQAQIAEAVRFEEQYFEGRIEALYHRSCGAIVFRRREGRIEFLCLLQRPSCTYSVPKGHMEVFETEEETAKRELFEETGIRADLLPGFREELSYDISDEMHKTVVLFLAEYDGPLKPDPHEVFNCRWIAAAKAKWILPAGYAPVLRRASDRIALLEDSPAVDS